MTIPHPPKRSWDPTDWHRADYILRGEYCPLPGVRDHLERIRRALDAAMLVHLAVDHEFLMRSLSWAVGTPQTATHGLSEWIRRADYKDTNRGFNDYVVTAANKWKSKFIASLSEELAENIVSRLLNITHERRSAKTSNLPASICQAFSVVGWRGYALNHTGRSGIEPWDGEVRSLLLVALGRPIGSEDERSVHTLGVRLKCTAESNARRDSVVMKQVMQRLSMAPSQNLASSLEIVSNEALRLACEITGSAGGSVYLMSPTPEQPEFRRLAEVTGPNFSYPHTLPFHEETTVGWAVAQHRAYQQIAGSSAAELLVRAVESQGGTELVTPIAGPLANTWAPAVGAIVLFHSAGDPRGYSAYERALVRNVALRLALFRTNIATREIATAISTLRSTSPRRLQMSPVPSPLSARVPWPKDITLATERFDEPLHQLADSTFSHSVTLRIALSDEQHKSEHGLALVRVAAYPAVRLEEPYATEWEGDPGLHWDVMRTGNEKYVSNTLHDIHFQEVRPGTVSSLCVPVKVEGVLAGTLNLESPFIDNYAPFLPLVVALSGAVGRTLADARAELEGALLDRAAHALARRHDFSGVLKAIETDLKGIDTSPLKGKLLDKVGTLQSLVQDLREPEVSVELQAKSLWEIVEDTRKQISLDAAVSQPTERLFHENLAPRASQSVAIVLSSVLRNVNYHSAQDARDSDGRPVPRISFGSTYLQGAVQAIVTVENLSLHYLEPGFCAELYRYPVGDPHGEIRLGTYIAGLNARRIGARIHANLLKDGKTLRTTLIVPVRELK